MFLSISFSLDHSNGVFEVNSRFTERFWTNSGADFLLFNLHDMETQQATAKQNRGKWITVNAEKDLFLTSAAPGVMAFVFPGYQGLEISSSLSCNFYHLLFSSSHSLLPQCHVEVTSEGAGQHGDILLLQLESVDVNNVEVVSAVRQPAALDSYQKRGGPQ